MRTVFISAGHSDGKGTSKDRGAVSNGFVEGDLTIEFRDLLHLNLKDLGVKVVIDNNSNAFSHSIAFFRNLTTPNSIVIDIHFNSSANPLSTGVETLIPAKYTAFEYNLAADISKCISETLGYKLRGTNGVKTELASHHGSLGWMRLTGENILLEIGFISNKKDMEIYQQKKHILAKKIAEIIFEYVKK